MSIRFNLFFLLLFFFFGAILSLKIFINVYKKEQIITEITDTKCVKCKIAIKPARISDNKILKNILITIFE